MQTADANQPTTPGLNDGARIEVERAAARAPSLHVSVGSTASGTRLLDFGITSRGGLEAGCRLAQICLAGRGSVTLTHGPPDVWAGPWIGVATDHPLTACLASQYAGWEVSSGDYFAMGSGPMRAARAAEELFRNERLRESPDHAVGVLETAVAPPDEICREIAEACRVSPERLTLCLARTASLAGHIQVVARSLETALHKLMELEFPLERVHCGVGRAPLPPVSADDLAGIGRTNDAVLYGAEVTVWVTGDDDLEQTIGPRVPSRSSRDYGRPFLELFREYDCDFYKIDPLLFSPAVVAFHNLDTGRACRFGEANPKVLQASFST